MTLELPEHYRFIGTVMRNLGHEIEMVVAERLIVEEAWGRYAGWDFAGDVWMDHRSEQWACAVYVRHEHQKTILGPTLPELMTAVSEKYGWD